MSTKIFPVSKFLGLNQSPDSATGLKLGEAEKIENFYITDDRKLKTRPGVSCVSYSQEGDTFYGMWTGFLDKALWTFLLFQNGHSEELTMRAIARNSEANTDDVGDIQLPISYMSPVKIFSFADTVWAIGASTSNAEGIRIHQFKADGKGGFNIGISSGYTPVVLTGCSPAGGGTEQEPINLLNDSVRIQFSGDGNTKEYRLPDMVVSANKVEVDNEIVTGGTYDSQQHIYTFAEAPAEGINNVELTCRINSSISAEGRAKFLRMRHCEAYNGATDTRLFFYGDGTNICYYTGAPAYGEGLYVPSGYEIAVDSSASAITGMRRHYTRLMAFKTDGTYSITYDPVTLADGRVVAGFYVRPASRDVGNDMDDQIQTVNNFPRTLCAGSLYEWRHTASYYQDERYAKRISEPVAKLLSSADPAKIVTCDDNADRTYYMFLNDGCGTVLVNRYDLDVWTVYTGSVFDGIRWASGFHGDMLFASDNCVFRFDPDSAFDVPANGYEGDPVPIQCLWESGYMAFGADYLRKYSSTLWISMLPEPSSKMDITVQTDRRDEYMVKSAGRPLLDFGSVDFSNFSFLVSTAPKMQRVRLKVKKFVYYKLIFRVDTPGARATVLGYDQQVRFASQVK